MIDLLLLCIGLYTHTEREMRDTYLFLSIDRYTQCIQVYLGVCASLIWVTTGKTYLNIALRFRD